MARPNCAAASRTSAPIRWICCRLPADSMGGFRFHGWLIVEIFTDAGHVGIGNAALVAAADEAVHRRLPRAAPHRPGSVRHRVPLAAHVSQDDGVWPEGRGDGRRSARSTSRSGIMLGKATNQPCSSCSADAPSRRIPVYASRLYSQPLDALAAELQKYNEGGYRAMKLRFGWGPADGAAGMQQQRRSRPDGSRNVGRRCGHHGGRVHGVEPRLCATDDSAARAVPSAMARGARHSGRPARLRRRSKRWAAFRSRAASTVSRMYEFRDLLEARASTTSSSTRTASAASRRRARLRRSPRRTRCPWCRTPARCTTTTSSWPA